MNIIFWLDSIPVCCKGVFDEVAKQWTEGQCYFVCMDKPSECRQMIMSSNEGEYDKNYIFLENKSIVFTEELMHKHINDVHIFNGYKSDTSKILDKLLKLNGNAKTVVWCERPSPKGKKQLLSPLYTILHTLYAIKYKNKINALLPLGNKGVQSYHKCGWPKEKLFPFLYLPVMNENIKKLNCRNNDPVKFVYLGRFSDGWKGTDVLIDSFKYLSTKNFVLDMVGGYGDYKDETLSWISKHENVNFSGTWPIEEACIRLSEYDVCIVPSRDEGWNVTVNEALIAGIGCLVTDGAVSDEMVSSSGAGLVVPARNPKKLAEGIDFIVNNSECVEEWKEKAYNYRPNMTAGICGKYFVDIIQYLFEENVKERPMPPWLK